MPRARVSTTVDENLLREARSLRSGSSDASLIDEALRALLASNRAVEIDEAYRVYEEQPLDAPDEWGDLESWHSAAHRS